MTYELWDHLETHCHNVKKFSISDELIIDDRKHFLKILPENLTHLSLRGCILNITAMRFLMDDTDSEYFCSEYMCMSYCNMNQKVQRQDALWMVITSQSEVFFKFTKIDLLLAQ